jgi:hypothetical protein
MNDQGYIIEKGDQGPVHVSSLAIKLWAWIIEMQESQKYYKKGTHVSKACAKQLAS